MSKNNAKSLTTLRQKERKYVRDFEEEMAAFRENPDFEESEAEKEDQEEDEEALSDEELLGPAAFKSDPSAPKYV